MTERDYFQDAGEPEAPKRRSFLTPFTCCLGCGGLFVVLLLAALAFLLFWLFPGEPLPFEMPRVPEAAARSAEAKIERLEGANGGEISLTADEVNAIVQEFLRTHFRADAPAKARVDLLPDGKVHVQVSLGSDPLPVLGRRYGNFDLIGRVSVKDGEILFSDVEKAQFGKLATTEDVSRSFQSMVSRWEKASGKGAEDKGGLESALRRVESLAVEGDALRVKLSPSKDEPR